MSNLRLLEFPFKSIIIGSFEPPDGAVEILRSDVTGDVVPGAVTVMVVGSGVVVAKVGPTYFVATRWIRLNSPGRPFPEPGKFAVFLKFLKYFEPNKKYEMFEFK